MEHLASWQLYSHFRVFLYSRLVLLAAVHFRGTPSRHIQFYQLIILAFICPFELRVVIAHLLEFLRVSFCNNCLPNQSFSSVSHVLFCLKFMTKNYVHTQYHQLDEKFHVFVFRWNFLKIISELGTL